MVTFCVGPVSYNTLLKEKLKGREEEVEYISSYLLTFRKREETGIFKVEALGLTLWGTQFLPVARQICYVAQYNILHSSPRELQMSYVTV